MALMDDPAIRLMAVTPNDTTDLGPVRALYVGGTGNVAVRLHGMSATVGAVTLTNLAAGIFHPVRARFVYATGTTATNIVAAY